MTERKIICLDFDGVLHSYSSGWKGADIIPDAPVPGALEFIEECIFTGFAVAVYSSRSHQKGGIEAMIRWFKTQGLDTDLLAQIDFPNHKPPAFLGIDDRVLTFNGPDSWPSIKDVENFQPWNKRGI